MVLKADSHLQHFLPESYYSGIIEDSTVMTLVHSGTGSNTLCDPEQDVHV